MGRMRKPAIAWIAVALWMLLIFIFSAQPTEQTRQLSMGITEKIMNTEAALDLQAADPSDAIVHQNKIIRKVAHFVLYLTLGVLACFALRIIGMKGRRVYLIAAVSCILYAFSDELHQVFVPGRHANLIDVLIDTTGALVGLAGYELIRRVLITARKS